MHVVKFRYICFLFIKCLQWWDMNMNKKVHYLQSYKWSVCMTYNKVLVVLQFHFFLGSIPKFQARNNLQNRDNVPSRPQQKWCADDANEGEIWRWFTEPAWWKMGLLYLTFQHDGAASPGPQREFYFPLQTSESQAPIRNAECNCPRNARANCFVIVCLWGCGWREE